MSKVTTPSGMNDAFARAFNARDLDALLSLYEPDAVMYGVDTGKTLRGRKEIAPALRTALNAPGTLVNVNNFCLELGEIALLRADYHMIAVDGSIGSPASSTEVARRQPDGSWLFMIDHPIGVSLPRIDQIRSAGH